MIAKMALQRVMVLLVQPRLMAESQVPKIAQLRRREQVVKEALKENNVRAKAQSQMQNKKKFLIGRILKIFVKTMT